MTATESMDNYRSTIKLSTFVFKKLKHNIVSFKAFLCESIYMSRVDYVYTYIKLTHIYFEL